MQVQASPFLVLADELPMQVSVDITDEMRREAEARGIPIVDYVELLIVKGREALIGSAVFSTAIERIRALRGVEKSSRG